MLDAFRRLFTKPSPAPRASQPAVEIEDRSIDDYFLGELRESKYIRPDCYAVVLKHLKHEASLTKTGNKLTADEKQALGLNPRITITKELVEVLTAEGLARVDPSVVLGEIYNKATVKKARTDNVRKSIDAGVEKFTLMSGGDNTECDWCKEHLNEEFEHDVLQVIEDNCTCVPYHKCSLRTVIEL